MSENLPCPYPFLDLIEKKQSKLLDFWDIWALNPPIDPDDSDLSLEDVLQFLKITIIISRI